MPQAPKKMMPRHPKILWTTEEVVLTVFLRSRSVKDRVIVTILNERFAPKVRQPGSIRLKMRHLKAIESKSGRIDLTSDNHFTQILNVDRWIMTKIDDAHARSGLLTFTQHELEVMGRNQGDLIFSSEDNLLMPGPSQMPPNPATGRREDPLLVPGPSQMPANPATGRREDPLPTVGPSQKPTKREIGRREDPRPAVGPGQKPTKREIGRREDPRPAVGLGQKPANRETGRREDPFPAVGPSQMPAKREIGRREDPRPAVGPGQMPANRETGRREDPRPAVGPSQILDQRTGQVMGAQRQMSNFSTLSPYERLDQSARPIWDATLEALFPGLGPRATPGEPFFTMQSRAGEGRAHDPYHGGQAFEEWYDPDGEESEDENEEEESAEDDDGSDAEYRFQRDENDNCWYDEDQEEEDG